jgi:hypothetical protein
MSENFKEIVFLVFTCGVLILGLWRFSVHYEKLQGPPRGQEHAQTWSNTFGGEVMYCTPIQFRLYDCSVKIENTMYGIRCWDDGCNLSYEK